MKRRGFLKGCIAASCLQVNRLFAAGEGGMPWLNILLGDVEDEKPAKTYPVYAKDYETQVTNYRKQYGKSKAWADWMIAHKWRYEAVFKAAKSQPSVVTISFRYDTVPRVYDPAWASEDEHMAALEKFMSDAFYGYNIKMVFNGNTSASYANIIANIPTNDSYAWGKNMYLYYETILNHEFGHIMKVDHHYDWTGYDLYMPPGETECIMNRSSSLYCSACRTALGIPLDHNSSANTDAALHDILDRY